MGRKNEATSDSYSLKPKSKDPSYTRKMGNYPAKKYKKGNPVVTRLSFEFTGPGTRFLDLSAALSALNRRAYRQGCYYYVNSIEFYDNANSVVDVHTLPDNYVTRAAHRRGKGIWDEMNERVLKDTPSILPKYHDFKVFMSARHVTTGTTMPVLHDINGRFREILPDEWAYSKIVTADDDQDDASEADDFYLHMLGDHDGTDSNWVSVGLIRSYAETRPIAKDLNPEFISQTSLKEDPLINVFDYSSEEQLNDIVHNLNEDNDAPPYDANVYTGFGATGQETDGSPITVVDMAQVARLNTTAETGRVAMSGGFCAPAGLICIDPEEGMNQDNKFRIVVTLAEGTYHGVYAERM